MQSEVEGCNGNSLPRVRHHLDQIITETSFSIYYYDLPKEFKARPLNRMLHKVGWDFLSCFVFPSVLFSHCPQEFHQSGNTN